MAAKEETSSIGKVARHGGTNFLLSGRFFVIRRGR